MDRGAWRAGHSPWGHTELEVTEMTKQQHSQLTNNVVMVLGGHRRDSAAYPFSPQTPLLSRLLRNIEQSSMCYLLLIHFKYRVCTCPSQMEWLIFLICGGDCSLVALLIFLYVWGGVLFLCCCWVFFVGGGGNFPQLYQDRIDKYNCKIFKMYKMVKHICCERNSLH